ncbi:MAG: efflux RND transporter periplasmic adaptor subunit [Elusimicrobiota bacterium]
MKLSIPPSLKYFTDYISRIKIPKISINIKIVKIIAGVYLLIMIPLTYISVKRNIERKKREGMQARTAQEDIPIQVKAFQTEREDFRNTLDVVGTVKGTSEVKLNFEISGKVASFNFREGAEVAENEVIASLDTEDLMTRLSHSRSKLDSVRKRHEAASEKLEVYKELYRMGAIIKAKLKEMELNVESLKAEVETARSEVKLSQSQLDKTIITAPSDGIMGTKYVEVGDFVTPNDVIGNFLKVENVFVEVGVIEQNINKISEGMKVKVNVDSYPDTIFWGEIDNISKMIRGEARTLPVEIKISNPGRKLISGMLAECEIFLTEFKDSIIIPTSSVINLEEMVVVPVIKKESEETGIIELREIEVGYTSQSYSEVVEGLDAGELLVLETQQPLKDGMKVKIIEIVKK